MKKLSLKISLLPVFCFAFITTYCFGQQGNTSVNQDKKIDILLDLKKKMNLTENTSDRYKIQIYSGKRTDAEAAQGLLHSSYDLWRSKIMYEPPNFKIWVGSFVTRLEADRALKEIKNKFPNAFIFKPKK